MLIVCVAGEVLVTDSCSSVAVSSGNGCVKSSDSLRLSSVMILERDRKSVV